VLKDYLPVDHESMGHGILMYWANPLAPQAVNTRTLAPHGRLPASVRIATVQFQMRRINAIEEFEEQVEYFVDVAADYKADFVLFPELFTLQLLSIDNGKLSPIEAIRKVAAYKDRFCAFMERLAVSYNINIIGGSHPTQIERAPGKRMRSAMSAMFSCATGRPSLRKAASPRPKRAGGTSRAVTAPMRSRPIAARSA
jgi:hypothetical protein